jgi:hypothetical protein
MKIVILYSQQSTLAMPLRVLQTHILLSDLVTMISGWFMTRTINIILPHYYSLGDIYAVKMTRVITYSPTTKLDFLGIINWE